MAGADAAAQVREGVSTEEELPAFSLDRLPQVLQPRLRAVYKPRVPSTQYLEFNHIHCGDARDLLRRIRPNSVALSVWSPPYFVGKSYEAHLSFADWQALLEEVVELHFPIIKPGGFVVVNIADILCFRDSAMPRIQAMAVQRQRSSVTRDDVLRAAREHPDYSRYQLAALLKCSEQTIDRRLNGNNIRGGKYEPQTRVKIVGGLVEAWALRAGFYPYDRRVWVKDAAWENSRWASLSYKAVDEFEYLYFLWKPGITTHDRSRLTPDEWKNWGSRGVWCFPSVRANDDHEAKFPVELPLRVIRLLTDPGDLVLDCFVGSGTTAVAAVKERRQYLGIDIVAESVELARRRVQAEAGGDLFHVDRP
ncbi:site-specific DNA-methyltransferase [candidate division WOR-3 bacterium]|nr:site-specific DNA-methyltransferase [candidate division WOR-3 bacterium]